jgi:hypothetical protein
MDYAALSSELLNDPEGIGYGPSIAIGDDTTVAAMCNDATSNETGQVLRADFTVWAVETAMYSKVKDLSNTVDHPLRDSALAILAVLEGGASTGIDFSKPENMATINAWEAAGVLSTIDKETLLGMSIYQLNRSLKLFGRYITAHDVAKALRGI